MGTEHSIASPSEVELIDDRIMVRYIEPENITKGGIHLPQTAVESKKERVQASTVISVGLGHFTSDGRHEAMMDILPGDIVFHAQYLGYLLIIPDEDGKEVEYRVFGQHDLLGYKKVAPRDECETSPNTNQCKGCQFWGRYNSKPGWKGYCIQIAKDKDGLEEACKLWKKDNLF